MKKIALIVLLTALILACNFPLVGQETPTPDDPMPLLELPPVEETPPLQELPPIEEAQSQPQLSPQEINTGTHTFHVVPTSLTCPLSSDEGDETRTVIFSENQVEITNANKEGSSIYQKIGENRYMRTNDSGRPIIVVLNNTGYVLEIYDVDADPNQTPVCAYYTFTIQD